MRLPDILTLKQWVKKKVRTRKRVMKKRKEELLHAPPPEETPRRGSLAAPHPRVPPLEGSGESFLSFFKLKNERFW